MTTVEIIRSEIESRTMTPEHREAAVQALREDGLVVLKDVVETEHLDMLLDRMREDLDALRQRKDAPYNWNTGNIQQDPPPFPPYLFRDILVNDMVVAVTEAVLGRGVKNFFYSGNTAVHSDQRQPVHADTGQLWPNLEVAHPACQLVVNVPLVAVSPENGSTELWPGSHLDTTVSMATDIKVPTDVLERRRAEVPPFQPTMTRGSILIRDIRLWHAGMPNRTTAPRPMIAMIHAPSWFATGNPLRFPKGTEDFFADSPLRTAARFVDGPIDHINAPQAYEYAEEE
jgi:ectoine hydroxylase-related dioxygenase (phytanoyl-CoA dioxygenase family)